MCWMKDPSKLESRAKSDTMKPNADMSWAAFGSEHRTAGALKWLGIELSCYSGTGKGMLAVCLLVP